MDFYLGRGIIVNGLDCILIFINKFHELEKTLRVWDFHKIKCFFIVNLNSAALSIKEEQ